MSEEDIYSRANDFIYDKMVKYFNIGPENEELFKEKFMKDNEVKSGLVKMYTSPEDILVFQLITQSGKEKWVVNPKDCKKKSVLILKSNKETGLDEDMSKNFIFMDLASKKVLEEMYDVCNDVFFPLLSQSVKNENQSDLISRELVEKFHNFLAHYYVCMGHKEGKTLLAIPSDEIFRNSAVVESEKTQICEGAVVMWTDQIRNILKQEPEHEFRNGKNPDPLTEIEFWKNRDETLNSIQKQIEDKGVKDVLEFLQNQKSEYFGMFDALKVDISNKATEAHYNYVYLKVLEKPFSRYQEETSELVDLAEDFNPIFHIIRKIYEDNKYYHKPERLIVLIRKICNALIDKCSNYIFPNVLGKISEDPEKEIERLVETKGIISQFMEAYFKYKDKQPSQGEENQEANGDDDGWHITRNVIFYRLDAFSDRIGDILNVAKSYFEFKKMSEKVLGGIRAESLQQQLKDIFDECTEVIKKFNAPVGEGDKEREFDALDITSDEFNNRYIVFKDSLKELERKISAVLTQSFDEAETILGKFKVLDNFDTILERPYISVELEKKYNILLDMYREELKIVQNMFLTGKKLIESGDPKSPLNKNMPPIAAKLNWTYSLKSRIQEPIERFRKCGKRITEKEEFKEIEASYDSISRMIDEFGRDSKIEWDKKAKVISIEGQNNFILNRKDDLINVNFDPELGQLLKEVKYLKILNMDIPDEANETFEKNAKFRSQISDLENIKSHYNNIIRQLNEVEKPMVATKMAKVETLLADGFNKLTWKDQNDIDKYTKKASDVITELSNTVDRLKAFVKKIEAIFIEYKREDKMLFQRQDKLQEALALKTTFVTVFDYKRGQIVTRVKDISSLQEVQNALKSAVPNLASFKLGEEWKNYQHYINSIVLNGSIGLILDNLNYLLTCLDPSLDPICSVRLELRDRKIFFDPEFYGDPTGNGLSIKDMIIEWINSFLNLSTLFRVRVDTSMGDYMIEVLENFRIQEIVYKLYNEISSLTKDSDEKLGEFNDFKMIWESDFDESFNKFLEENTVIPEPTDDQKDRLERVAKVFNEKNPNPIIKNIREFTPSKEIFDDKINEFKDKLKKVKNMPNNANVRWIQIDFTGFKDSLKSNIEEWIEKYKDFLRTNSKNKIENIENFMNRVKNGIINKPTDTSSKEDKEKFYQLLENIRDMELLYPQILELIPTIKGELAVLTKHMKRENEDDPFDIEERTMDSEEQSLITKTAEIEKTIVELKKQVDSLNEEINELTEKEKQNFRQEEKDFEQQLSNFRSTFLANAPKTMTEFTVEEVSAAYQKLDDFYAQTIVLEEQMKKNNDMELLLKIPLSKNQEIADCLRDLQNIKVVWDFASLNFEIYESWKKIKISEMDIRELTDLSEGLKSNMTNVKKEIKNSVPAYNSLNQKTKEVNATMCQIQNLTEGTAIKPRHWRHLQDIIKKQIPYDSPDFAVRDFFDLEIYKYSEEVESEKATAEGQAKMEKDYNDIDKRWQTKKFEMTCNLNKKTYDFNLFDHGEMDKIIEVLETDIIKLTSMAQKKNFLENFEGMADNINNKLNTLKIVCDVTKQWLKLQKNWEKLEVIFLKSDDIQNKLRDKYDLFKQMDEKFHENMKDAYDYSIMIDVCTLARKEAIDGMIEQIDDCQKALDNYLGTKKKAFPRFYFVSNDTLLGMLSQADYPNLINKNVKDCFDGIKYWTMKDQDAGGRSNTVYAMCSADNGEVVELENPFIVKGQLVESYLTDFEATMRETLTKILYKAYGVVDWNSATGTGDKMKDDKTRHLWLNPFPAQIALLVTQIIWTEEVEHALEATDGGDSGALKEFYELSVKRIEHLIDRVRDEPLTRDLRVKIITVITVDVHGRDVVEAFSKMKPAIESGNFNWKKQLRFYYFPEKKSCDIRICDYITNYSYEYIGNTGRLVITPLTDRCYITLTQALNLILGGAPAGPAGTGKTETVKDLGRNMGLGVIVNNCSEQMDIETTARIFSGLSQTGFWGCFDEFNRILIEVLSVVSAQVKVVLDALRENKTLFNFQGDEICLVKTVGFFITMNPGYAGRTELPDNLKALFRSCAMVVPDLKEICQNMLMSEGFSKAKPIASKFITLYTLSKDLLSKQIHYDWGLRAIKSLLRQAGGLKRHEANKSKDEFTIIKTALYDFNKAKIVVDDIPIFERLLGDLFNKDAGGGSGGKEDESIYGEINAKIDQATECKDVQLQRATTFTIKTRQLKEILEVRHCLFILGAPGSGKTCVWKTLFYTNMNYLGEISKYAELSPKSVTGFELFGYNDERTKVWKYGILSATMKKMCKNEPPYTEDLKNKWIILDGDIDPNWIESLNTVMDDNKVLTLTNGDRFPLDEFMRLIFEVSNLRNATPATVSRGGVLYIGEYDIGITPCFDKWVKDRYSAPEFAVVKRSLQEFFKPAFDKINDIREEYIAPIVHMTLLHNFMTIFQNLMDEVVFTKEIDFKGMEDENKALIAEGIFFMAYMWGVGGGLKNKEKTMHPIVNSMIKSKNKIRIPEKEKTTCFDYFFDSKKIAWVPWLDVLSKPEIGESELFSDIIIPNVEVTRLSKITSINMIEDRAVLFVGGSGTGKSAVCKYFLKKHMEELSKLKKLRDTENDIIFENCTINFNSFTESAILQNNVDSNIKQRVGCEFGPEYNHKKIFFLDDLNMPQLDQFGTQSHVELLRQIIDYKFYYDRKELENIKKLKDLLFIGAQNPTAGSFVIDLRLQRHFTLLATSKPSDAGIKEIYTFICENHFSKFSFTNKEDNKSEIIKSLVDGTYQVLEDVTKDPHFNPSAAKFHYQWNMREVCKVVGGVLRSSPTFFKTGDMLYKLWFHECNRVYRDRLIYEDDFKSFDTLLMKDFDVICPHATDLKEDLKEPFIFVPFGDEIGDDMPEALIQFKSYPLLKKHIEEAKEQYNEEKGDLPLVLFDDAIQDICRISRIISNSCSNALLVGVGGSGKQSLSRLAAFIKEIEFALPNLSGTDYNRESFLNDIKKVMDKAVLKQGEVPYTFLVNDNHLIDEYFLVYINTFLSSYWIEELYDPKELLGLMEKNLRTGCAECGFAKTSNDCSPEQLKEYLIYRVKKSVHFIICMSPVGDTLRVRVRKFPSILSGSSIDWFHDWPDKALIAVSSNDIGKMEQFQVDDPENEFGDKKPGEQVVKIATIASLIHKSINDFNKNFYESERRYNYTTPKSFLELVKYFKQLVGRKMDEIDKEIARLKQGLETVDVVTKNVNELKENIAVKSVDVKAANEKTEAILQNLSVETAKNAKEKDIVEAATREANEANAIATEKKSNADAALAEAVPAMKAAEAAAKDIDTKELDKFKNPNKPSERNFMVFKLIYLIFNPKDKIPSNDIGKEMPIIKSKALSKTSEQIKNQLIALLNDISWITPEFLQKVQMWREPPFSDKKEMMKVSGACASICEFFQNMCLFYEKKQIVNPLQEAADKASQDSAVAQAKADDLNARYQKLTAKQRELEGQLHDAEETKAKIEAEMQALQDKLAIAEKFLYLLGDSKERWIQQSQQLAIERENIAGDCVLGSSFVSYIGVFNSFFRTRIIEKWQEIILANDIKVTPNIDIVHSLTSEVEILQMKGQGLPQDPFSEENAVIITQCTRYPLIIDPQMQAIGWLKNRSEKKCIVQYKQKSWDTIIGEAIGTGDPLIVEDVDQEIDPLLQPIMGKQTTNKDKGGTSKNVIIRVGSNDYPFNINTPIYFLTKISNPHYKPEIVAQCTLVNFIVTEKGLEDQLLAQVVNIEKPDLEENIRNYVTENNKLQADLLATEADVLAQLTAADSQTILENITLLNKLEEAKNSSEVIKESKKKTEDLIKEINEKREIYRGVGEEGAMLFFLIGKLFIIKYMYQYSLNSFLYFFEKAIGLTEKTENPQLRVQRLREKIRITVYVWISAGMFESDKKLLLTLISIRLLQKNALVHESLAGVGNKHIQFLLKCPGKPGTDNAFKGLIPDNNWDCLVYMSELEGLQGFAEKVEKEYNNKFREWYNEIAPEDVDLPVEYKKYKKHSFHKILILRACRKERVGIALNEFIRVCLPEGEEFLRPRTFSENLESTFDDSKPETPLFFILSPGSNPIADLQILGGQKLPKKIKKKFEYGKNFTDIPMGQGAEAKAEEAMKNCNANGEWLILQNIHLMPKWLASLEDKLKEIAKEKGHEDFRLFLSAEPSDKIPVGILEKCIKLTNEPPSGLKENMCIAFNTLKNNKDVSFNDEKRRCGVIFGLCYYHAVVIERKKFGSLGWNRNYPFSLDDLRNSDAIVGRYIEPGVSRIPWEDLKYIVGEIMYGGHIVDDMDRVLNNAYLNYILDDKLLVDLDLVPYPSNSWDKYITEVVTSESPALFGLHPNAEIEYRINESDTLFKNLIDLEPKESSGGGEGGEGNAYTNANEFCDTKKDIFKDGQFNIENIRRVVEGEIKPEQNVFIQECEYMNNLNSMIYKSLLDVQDAIKGTLSMDERIESLIFSLFNQRVPAQWVKKGFSSMYNLTDWMRSLEKRIDQLKEFENQESTVPKVVFINRLFNPLSYLTAIRQISARKQNQELDKLNIFTEPTKYYLEKPEYQKDTSNIILNENSGVPIYGLHLQGCSMDAEYRLAEAISKKTYFVLPILCCKVVPIEQLDPKGAMKNYYICPIYKTIDRQSTFVCFAQFKSKEPPAKWTIAGVAAILECSLTDSINLLKFGK